MFGIEGEKNGGNKIWGSRVYPKKKKAPKDEEKKV